MPNSNISYEYIYILRKHTSRDNISGLNNFKSIKHYLLFLSVWSLFKYSIFIGHYYYYLDLHSHIFTSTIYCDFNHFSLNFVITTIQFKFPPKLLKYY